MAKLAETSRSPPPSPTRFALRSLITGVPPTDPSTHAQRWRPSPKTNGVAGLVKAFEKSSLSSSNSLSSSRPYSTHASSPKISPPLSPSPVSPTRTAGIPTVPASFFQAQQSRRPPSHAPTEKENHHLPPTRDLSKPLPSRGTPSEVSSTGASEGAHSVDSGTSFITVESSIRATVERAHVEQVQQATPRRVLVAPTIVQTAPTPRRDERPVERREERREERPVERREEGRPVARRSPTSYFIEALPVSFPYGREEEYERMPVQEEKTEGRPRASTVGAGLRPQGFEAAEEKAARVGEAFAQLLDTMQLPSRSVRTKMLGLTQAVKEEMLRSSAPRPTHARAKSLNVIEAPLPAKKDASIKLPSFLRKTKSSTALRPASLEDVKRVGTTSGVFRSLGRSAGVVVRGDGEDPMWWAVRIRSARCVGARETELSVKEVGRLRGRLRGEQPEWVDEFVKHGGYLGLLERLKELLDVEWREEQHDDQMLQEILRCFKALTLTSVGKTALASRSPAPFTQLTSLLFSEKHPGDLPCRQLLVELIQSLFDICPASAGPITAEAWKAGIVLEGGERRYMRKMKGEEGGREATHEMVVSLLSGPGDEREEAKVDFIRSTHKPRVFKAWVKEITDVVRDYFWIFCHHGNLFGNLDQINEDSIEAPQVPTGMTGGVESEAMTYCTAQFRLINAVASTCPNHEAAFQFHLNLFDSGLETVLITLRRASQAYYAPLHLEMARYVHHARKANFNLGPKILGFLDPRTLSRPEQEVIKEYQRRNPKSKSSGKAPQLAEVAF